MMLTPKHDAGPTEWACVIPALKSEAPTKSFAARSKGHARLLWPFLRMASAMELTSEKLIGSGSVAIDSSSANFMMPIVSGGILALEILSLR
jgi:hypothetical protein